MDDSFPSVHVAVVSTLYGFLAVLAAEGLSFHRRRLPYTIVAVWIALVVVAHLYLGRHWLSDAIGGVMLGVIWSGILGIAYRRHSSVRMDLRGLWVALLLAVVLVGGGHLFLHYDAQLVRNAVHQPQRTLDAARWWQEDWKTLARYRIDWGGEATVPMTLQVAGDLTEVSRSLQRHGWQVSPALDAARILRIFVPDPEMADLPVLPYAHDGHQEALQLTYYSTNTDTNAKRFVLHLWRADAQLAPGNLPLWVGNITCQQMAKPLGLVTLPRTVPEYVTPLAVLRPVLDEIPWHKTNRPGPYPTGWDGTVLLLWLLHTAPPREGR